MKVMLSEYWLFTNYYFMETFSCRKCTSTYFALFSDFWSILVCLVDILNNCWFIYRSNSTSTPKTHSHSRSSSHHHSRSSHHHHHRRSHRSRHSEDMVDSLALSNTEPKRPIPSSPISRRASGKSGGFRNWNPPMLGTLPDDFLRLTVPKSPDPLSLDGFLPLQNSSERTHHNISSRKNRHTERLSNSSSEQKKKISRSRSERAPERPKWSHGGDHFPMVRAPHGQVQNISPGMSKSLVSKIDFKMHDQFTACTNNASLYLKKIGMKDYYYYYEYHLILLKFSFFLCMTRWL